MIHVAVCQYCIELLPDWKAYTTKIESLVSKAKGKGAQLLLLPEYAGIESVTEPFASDLQLFTHTQSKLSLYLSFYQELARHHQMYIQPGTIVVEGMPHQFYNRAYLFSPNGSYAYQDKLHFVKSEKEHSLFLKSNKQTIFKTDLGLIGIAVCYDCEFPEMIRQLTHLGVKLILVPSYTPSLASFQRVFYSCHARAIENQCYVVMSSAVGKVKFGDSHENLSGQANLFTPIDEGFPIGGILQQGKMNEVMTIFGTLSFDKIDHIREHGQVSNFNDFQNDLQFSFHITEVVL